MKKILVLLVLALVVFLAVCRQRIFLWDPLATVERDGVKQGGVRVMIDYSNDVLMEDRSTDRPRFYLVQHWDGVARYATGQLRCIHYLACMTDADQATGETFTPGVRGRRTPVAGVTMTNKRVEFVDEKGALVAVSLR